MCVCVSKRSRIEHLEENESDVRVTDDVHHYAATYTRLYTTVFLFSASYNLTAATLPRPVVCATRCFRPPPSRHRSSTCANPPPPAFFNPCDFCFSRKTKRFRPTRPSDFSPCRSDGSGIKFSKKQQLCTRIRVTNP